MGSTRTAADDELEAATDWLGRYGRSKNVIVAYHADPDGVVAATFMGDLLRNQLDCRLEGIAVRTHEFDFSRFRQQLLAATFDALVAVDINFASRPGFLSWLARDLGKPALIYDDHLVREQPPGPAGFRYINPTVNRCPELPVPACFFAYLSWSGKRDDQLGGAKLSDLVEIGLFGESVLPDYVRELDLEHAPLDVLDDATRRIYAFYAKLDWPVTSDPVLERLSVLLTESADAKAIADDLDRLDAVLGHISTRLDAAVRISTDQVLSVGDRSRMADGAEIVVGRIVAPEFLLANLVASNARNHLRSGIAIACQELPGRTVVELRRSRNLTMVDLDSAVQRVAHLDGVINSGGHPPAAGMAIEPDQLESVLAALRHELAVR